MKSLFFGYVNVGEKYVKKAGFHTGKYGLLRKTTPLIRVYGFIRTKYVLGTYFQNHHKTTKMLTSFLKSGGSTVWGYKFPFDILWGNGLATFVQQSTGGPHKLQGKVPTRSFSWPGVAVKGTPYRQKPFEFLIWL